MAPSLEWPVHRVRHTFFSYLEENQHSLLSSTPVIPVDDPKVPLIHTCLNRFKGILDGLDSKRPTSYSLRCILASGDEDVMDHFRNDTGYHRLTEVLGSSYFGDCKEEAIKLSWSLLSKVYKLPQRKIYITYFSGDMTNGLSSDIESKKILQKYQTEDRIVPSTCKVDFWMTAKTGRCGPCIGFFFDRSDNQDGVASEVNINDDKFIEIGRLVFVQFNKQADGVLRPLKVKAKHIFTGMNVECLSAILQNKTSHYDLDIFRTILDAIHYCVGTGIGCYSGKVGPADTDGVDAAYRLLADHLRMISAATSSNSQLGFGIEGRECFPRCADKQAVQFGHKVLNTDQEKYPIILNIVLRSDALCPALELDAKRVDSIIEGEVKIYKKAVAELLDQKMQPPLDKPTKKKKGKKKGKKNKEKEQKAKEKEEKAEEREEEKAEVKEEEKAEVKEEEKAEVKEEEKAEEKEEEKAGEKEEEKAGEKEEEKAKVKEEKSDEKELKSEEKEKAEGKEKAEQKANVSCNLNIRSIDFFGRSTHVVHQNNDGPCPLIAICNVLLLKGKIYFDRHELEVPMEYLLDLVRAFLKESEKMQTYCSELQKKIYDVVPTLVEGLDVDVVFNRTDGFTLTPECMLLDCLDISLRHGWFAGDLLAGVPSQSFERLSLAANEPNFLGETIKKFLRGPQLTQLGLVSLQKDLTENVPCILYWNKHYSTIMKFKGALYTLVTDSSYLGTSIVWQTLSEVNGDELYVDSSFASIYPGLSAAPLENNAQDNVQTSPHFVPERTPTSSAFSLDPDSKEDCISLEEFIKLPGNHFAELKTLFADGTSLDIADTTKIGRVIGLDLLELVFSHDAGFSWNGAFDLSTIYVINNARAEIRAPYCPKFSEAAIVNDFLTYICQIVELFRVDGVGLPAFFPRLVNVLSKPPRKDQMHGQLSYRQLEGFQHRVYGFWDCVLTTLALKPSMSRAGLFNGIHRIRRFAPLKVRQALRAVLNNRSLMKDWRRPIAERGHPVLKKVLRYIPGVSGSGTKGSTKTDDSGESGSGTKGSTKADDSGESSSRTKGSTKAVDEKETQDGTEDGSETKTEEKANKFGLFTPDVCSLSVFPRQVNEHGKPKDDDVEPGEEDMEEPFKKLSELELLSSHYLQDSLDIVLEALLCSDEVMTSELWNG